MGKSQEKTTWVLLKLSTLRPIIQFDRATQRTQGLNQKGYMTWALINSLTRSRNRNPFGLSYPDDEIGVEKREKIIIIKIKIKIKKRRKKEKINLVGLENVYPHSLTRR